MMDSGAAIHSKIELGGLSAAARYLKSLVGAAALLLAVPGSAGAGILVDGSLGEWVSPIADNNGSAWSPVLPAYGGPGTTGLLAGTNPHLEDQNDNAGHGAFLGPNYGGQDYDAEYMAVAITVPGSGKLTEATIHIAISTGVRPDNGFSYFGPGDIRIEANGTRYGIEVGGGPGGGSGLLLEEGAAGSTYDLNGSGYTTGHTSLASQKTGEIYKNAAWIDDPIAPPTPVQMDASSADLVETADYAYTRDTVTGQHAMMELSFSAQEFLTAAGGLDFQVYWSPACGNDLLHTMVSLAAPIIPEDDVPVPEPATVMLFVVGLAGLGSLMRCRKQGPAGSELSVSVG